jgi:hypothetical protein
MEMTGEYFAEATHRHKSNGSWMESTRFKTEETTEQYLERINSN